jgi:hypothetical protein
MVAITPGLVGANNGPDDRFVEAADAAELGADDVLLGSQLGRVGEVLELAATALAEERAAWLDAVGRGFEDAAADGFEVVAVDALDLGLHELAGGGEGNEHDAAVEGMGESRAAVDDRLDAKCEHVAGGDGGRGLSFEGHYPSLERTTVEWRTPSCALGGGGLV